MNFDGKDWDIEEQTDNKIILIRKRYEIPRVTLWIDEAGGFPRWISSDVDWPESDWHWLIPVMPLAVYYKEYTHAAVDEDGMVALFRSLPEYQKESRDWWERSFRKYMLTLPPKMIPADCSKAIVELVHETKQ